MRLADQPLNRRNVVSRRRLCVQQLHVLRLCLTHRDTSCLIIALLMAKTQRVRLVIDRIGLKNRVMMPLCGDLIAKYPSGNQYQYACDDSEPCKNSKIAAADPVYQPANTQ